MGAVYGNGAEVKRLTWLVGPPSAGKSTFCEHIQKAFTRKVEFDKMLGPIVDEYQITKGVLTGNHLLIQVVRQIELRAENLGLPPILVCGVVNPEKLYPLSKEEEVWIILPKRSTWLKQLKGRTTSKDNVNSRRDHQNIDFSGRIYDQIKAFTLSDRPFKLIKGPFNEKWLGKA